MVMGSQGLEHYREAERLLAEAQGHALSSSFRAGLLAEAQVHATLAHAAATVDAARDGGREQGSAQAPTMHLAEVTGPDGAQGWEGFGASCSCGWVDPFHYMYSGAAGVAIKSHFEATRALTPDPVRHVTFSRTIVNSQEGLPWEGVGVCSCGWVSDPLHSVSETHTACGAHLASVGAV